MKTGIIQMIKKEYVGEDCVQIMLKYKDKLAIKDAQENLIFYDNDSPEATHQYCNNYVNDERRKQFPYYDIPVHQERVIFKKYNSVNIFLNYDEIYEVSWELSGVPIKFYCKAIKGEECAIVIQDIELSSLFYMSFDELKGKINLKTPEPKIRKYVKN